MRKGSLQRHSKAGDQPPSAFADGVRALIRCANLLSSLGHFARYAKLGVQAGWCLRFREFEKLESTVPLCAPVVPQALLLLLLLGLYLAVWMHLLLVVACRINADAFTLHTVRRGCVRREKMRPRLIMLEALCHM